MSYRVLMIAPTSFFADYGCHVRILEEARILQALGNQVLVCTYHNGNDVPGLAIKRSLDVPWRKGVEVGSSRHKLYFDAMLLLRVAQVCRRFRPTVLHAHLHEGAFIGSWLRRWARVPLVFDYQGSMTSEMIDHHFLKPASLLHGPLAALEHWINRQADAILTSSHNAAQVLADRFGVGSDRVTVVPDSVDLERFRPGLAAADRETLLGHLGVPPGRRIVVYLGLLAPYQGTDLLLEASARVRRERPDTHFLIMGYPGVDSYRELAAHLGAAENVTFPGRIPYEDAHRYLALGDVAVFPKMSATEGAGKLANYMAMGLPTVAFETRVAREVLGDLGIYVPTGDPHALASGIIGALDDGARRGQLSRRLRERAELTFSWEREGRQIMDVYEQVINPATVRAPALVSGQLPGRPSD